jgi:hypothetical protein
MPPNPGDPVTEVSGIGSKTAEKLRERHGIATVGDLVEHYEAGGRFESSRAQRAAREVTYQTRERVEDPYFGVVVDEGNRPAVETFIDQTLGDMGSVYDRRDAQGDPNVTADTPMLDLGRAAERGRLFDFISPATDPDGDPILSGDDRYHPDYEERKARARGKSGGRGKKMSEAEEEIRAEQQRSISRFRQAVDVAANVFGTDREVVEDAIRKRGRHTRRKGDPVSPDVMAGSRYDRRVQPRTHAAAEAVNRSRSAKARRVDRRRDAPVTTDLDEWAEDPDHHDFPGVDTPESRQQAYEYEPGAERAAAAVEDLVEDADEAVRRRAFAGLGPFDDPEGVVERPAKGRR